jgi:hypothetical protein
MLGELIKLNQYIDEDGYLVSMEPEKDLPIEIKRAFYISGVKKNGVRANHAAINASFVFISVEGSIRIKLTNGMITEKYILEKGSFPLYVKENTWITADCFSSEDAVLLVFSDKSYNSCVYENNYANYIFRREKIDEICNNRSQ